MCEFLITQFQEEAKLANGLGLSRLRQKDDLIALEEEKTLVYQANKRIKVVSEKTKVVAKKVGKFLGETASGLADTLLPKYFKDRRNLKEYNQLQGKKTTTQRSLKVLLLVTTRFAAPLAFSLRGYAVSTSRRQ